VMCRKCENDARVSGDPNDPIVLQQFWDQEYAWYRDTINKHGWAIQFVSGSAGESPAFAYTVGLTNFRHPELLVVGIDDQASAGGLLNQLGRRVRDGEIFRDGQEIVTSGPPVRMFDVPNPGEIIFTANHFFGRPRFDSLPALQAIYPDAHGTWPWEPECHLSAERQPMPGTFRG
jgi:hypothetical protein